MSDIFNRRFLYSIGIDLGLTNIRMGIYHPKKTEIIPIKENQRSMPFVISFTDYGIFFGDDAKNQFFAKPKNTIYDLLLLLGRKYSDTDFQRDMKNWPFKVVSDDKDRPKIEVSVNNQIKHFFPEEILSIIFEHLKQIASSYLSLHNKYKQVRQIQISVPSFLCKKVSESIQKAAKIANFDCCYAFEREYASVFPIEELEIQKFDKNDNFLIIHIGGKIYNATIYNINRISEYSYELNLGGNAFDEKIVNYFVDRFNEKYKNDEKLSPIEINKLQIECEKAKIKLSSENEVIISCELKGHTFIDKISRSTFEMLNNDLFNVMINHIEKVLQKSHMKKEDITKIFLIGGSSKIPRIQQIIKEFFLNKLEIYIDSNPDEKAALGIAKYANFFKKLEYMLLHAETLILTNLTQSIGIGTYDGNYIILIDKKDDANYFMCKKHLFTTSKDYQEKVIINVYNGDMAKCNENHFLCNFEFDGIKPELRGVPQIEITMRLSDYLNHTYIKIKVEDKKTGNYNKYIIDYKQAEIQRNNGDNMIVCLNNFILKNDKTKEEFDAKMELQNFCFNARNIIFDNKFASHLTKSEVEYINNEINNALEWSDSHKDLALLDFENKKQEIEKKLNPYIHKIDPTNSYQKIDFIGCLPDE